jgi:small subunit ribosomal protein S16
MLAIRLQRTGRKGHAQFRMIVQEARRTPSSGNIVAALGHYDPHTKAITVDKEKAGFYLTNGAQPSPRVALLLQKEGVALPAWVKVSSGKQRAIKNTEKLRRNRPAEEIVEEPAAETTEAPAAEVQTTEENADDSAEA